MRPTSAIRLPKVESGADVDRVVDRLGAVAIAAVVETAVGVEALGEITRHRAVRTVSLGEADLASDLGTRHPRVLDAVRARLLVAARAAGLPPPMASVFTDIADLDGLRADTRGGAGDGVRRPGGDPPGAGAGDRRRVRTRRYASWPGPTRCSPSRPTVASVV